MWSCPTPVVGADLLDPRIINRPGGHSQPGPGPQDRGLGAVGRIGRGTLKERVEAMEAEVLRETLIRHRRNRTQAAEELGLSRVGLRAKIERYGVGPSPLARVSQVSSAQDEPSTWQTHWLGGVARGSVHSYRRTTAARHGVVI